MGHSDHSSLEPVEQPGGSLAASAAGSLVFLAPSDKPIISRYLELYQEREELIRIRQDEGHFVYDIKTSEPKPHPVIKMISDVEKMLLAIEKETGMTPASRLRLLGDDLANTGKRQTLNDMLDGVED